MYIVQHCNPLQGNYRVELVHREIPVVITGNEFTEYSFLLFWLHFFPCFNNIEISALIPVMSTGKCQFILQGLKGCFKISTWRKSGLASNPLFILPGFFLHFSLELSYGYLWFEGNGKIPLGR